MADFLLVIRNPHTCCVMPMHLMCIFFHPAVNFGGDWPTRVDRRVERRNQVSWGLYSCVLLQVIRQSPRVISDQYMFLGALCNEDSGSWILRLSYLRPPPMSLKPPQALVERLRPISEWPVRLVDQQYSGSTHLSRSHSMLWWIRAFQRGIRSLRGHFRSMPYGYQLVKAETAETPRTR